MTPESPNPGKELCSVHEILQQDIRDIKKKQEGRPCQTHTEKVLGLERADSRIENDNKDQWVAINKLRIMVYMGAGATGILAFLGSVLGTYLKGR